MKSEHYLLLNAARPRGQDDALPEIAAALEAIESDEEALDWLHKQRTYDAEVGVALRTIDPPAHLIGALHKASVRGNRKKGSNRRYFLGWPLAAAAAGVAGYWRFMNSGMTTEKLIKVVNDISANGITLSFMNMDRTAVAGWLEQAKAPRTESLPPKLDVLTRKGCHLYDIEGHPVSLECFLLPENMRQLHLFTVRSTELKDAPSEKEPLTVIPSSPRQTVALWSKSGYTMLLVSKESEADVRAILS